MYADLSLLSFLLVFHCLPSTTPFSTACSIIRPVKIIVVVVVKGETLILKQLVQHTF